MLLFLFTGMLFGSDGLGLEFNSHEDAQLIGMLSLSVILFSGGMDTKFRDIQPVVAQGLVLSTLGVLLTTAITGMLIFYLSEWTNLDIGLTLPMSILLAATVSSTDSASVFNLLRSQHIGLNPTLTPIFLFPCCHRRSSVLDYFTVYYKLLFFSRKAFSYIPASRRCPQPPSSACCTA